VGAARFVNMVVNVIGVEIAAAHQSVNTVAFATTAKTVEH